MTSYLLMQLAVEKVQEIHKVCEWAVYSLLSMLLNQPSF